MPSDPSQVLTPFGFTSLESEIYTMLLKESPATGYRVAQSIGKAAANTYKALATLQQKGAVLVEDGATKLFRSVPSDELLARLTRDFEWRRAEAEIALARLNVTEDDDRIYTLQSPAQVFERARHMLGEAGSAALLACSGNVARQLHDALAACGRRQLPIIVACSDDVVIDGVIAVVTASPSGLDEIRLATDGCQHLLGRFDGHSAHAVWSGSPYLSLCAYRGLAAEFAVMGLTPVPAESTPGFRKLI